MSTISVSVQFERMSGPLDIRVCKEIEPHFVDEAYQPIDIPEPDAHIFSQMLCSSPGMVRQVKRRRQGLAEALAHELTVLILETMEANDKRMGYTAKEQAMFDAPLPNAP